MVRDRMVVIGCNVLVRGTISSVILVYAPQCDLDNILKIAVIIVVIAGDFNGHTGIFTSDTEGQHEGYGYAVRRKGKGFKNTL